MRWTESFITTLRDSPSDAELASHKLMVRAGLISKLSSGIYTFLPLGLRVLRKVEAIVREEMNRAGAEELLMPILSPAELWSQSGRWSEYGKELMRVEDRHGREFALGPTHEEIITDLVKKRVKSYRQLPICLYQIQTKFRDEIRPRFGVVRAREFMMKDAYSFHEDEDCLDRYYWVMHGAYSRIFERCGFDFRAVLADSGIIGGDVTHEFMALADSGESVVISCPNPACGYAATAESAEGVISGAGSDEKELSLEKVHTPGMRSVEEVSAYLGVEPSRLIKTLIYTMDGGNVSVLVRGDREISEAKLKRVLGTGAELSTPDEIREVTGADVGYAGPVGLDMRIIADESVRGMVNAVSGANETDYHLVNIVPGRDFSVDGYFDIACIRSGDGCGRCGSGLTEYRGIELGQIFKLGKKYSEKMGAVFSDRNGEQRFFVMGCYGIGVSRIVAAAIESGNDEDGIIWPKSIAPYQVTIVPVNFSDARIRECSETIYRDLQSDGIETLIDDRDERAGVKFKDADLIGIPLRVTVGRKLISSGMVELVVRSDKRREEIPVADTVERVRELIQREG
jgi:prolyl-tRNA synthetase